MKKDLFLRFTLATIAISTSVIALGQIGVIEPAWAISNNVVVDEVVSALRSDHNALAGMIKSSCN